MCFSCSAGSARFPTPRAGTMQAFSILADPYANAYSPKWRDPAELTLGERNLGRGGWVATRNYELVRV